MKPKLYAAVMAGIAYTSRPEGSMSESWVRGANEPHGFGLNHLPYGVMRESGRAWICVRIGEWALSLADCVAHELLDSLSAELRQACLQPSLNVLLKLPPASWAELRKRITELLAEGVADDVQARVQDCLYAVEGAEMALPVAVGDYTDFYASIDHARRVGEIFRPDHPLLPNYRHVPIAYHGRASSIVVSGTPIRRPYGQLPPAGGSTEPGFGPSAALDYEAELALVIGGENALGEPVPVGVAGERIFGLALLNDWSARDIQSWEYQPLGPFLGKSFATSLSAWITPMAALEPFRVPARLRTPGEPRPLPYLWDRTDQAHGGLDVRVEVELAEAGRLSATHAREMYWTPAQMVAHHTSNGCNLCAGDLLGTGTLSGAELSSAGCLMELTRNGIEPVAGSAGMRTWLLDGDEVRMTAGCEREGMLPIHLGECVGKVLPARA